ncbi:MAG TPA: DUF1549 domain-containing protein [Isosphaeraceae bacterium]|nr:DUF1549 domain-containing protein [Isosphaeraceae bacterium]
MPRRRWVVRAGLAVGLVLVVGCRARVALESAPPPGPATAGRPAPADPGRGPAPQAAATPVRPAPAAVRISPEVSTIAADDPGLQLLAADAADPARDRTVEVQWTAEPAGLAAIEPGGYLRPLAPGVATVHARRAGADGAPPAEAKVTIEPRSSRPWDFGQDIVPIFTRLGCNTGSCHGRLEGQNGFHLSLFGYDPAGDYQAIARDAGQRRLSRLAPEQSLLLAKATGQTAHGGGRRMTIGSPDYQSLLAWVRDGAPQHRGQSHGAVVAVRVEPQGAVRLAEPGTRQLRVVAQFADGHHRDVTRMALYRVNDDSAASVSPQGRLALIRRAETDLIVRYQSHVLATRLSTVINPDLALDFSRLKRRNFIDDELFKRLESLKVPPSPPAGDAAFLRRAALDLTGEQPTPEEVRGFLADKDPEKRAKLIDRLLRASEFVLFWRIKLGDLLQISSARQGNGAYRYHTWIERALAENRPWDEVVRTLLTAVGDPNDLQTGGPVNYAMDTLVPNEQAELTAQRFLGLRMRCAQCHDHPFDVWTQDAYYGLAAFFAKVQRNGAGPMMGRTTISINPKGQVVHLRTRQPVQPRLLDGTPVKVPEKEDPRKALAAWITAPENPYFARAMTNWVWAQLFGKGLVDPPDDMSRANPPVHPELLDALARHFVAHKYDLRDLIRTIANSEAYGLSSAVVKGNEHDTRLFSHHLPRPLTAHQMADALAQATNVPNLFPNRATRGRLSAARALQIYDPATPSLLLDTFGRCARTVTCAASPAPTLNLRQALLLIGGDVIEGKVSNLNGYLAGALKLELEPEELVENLYYRTVCRPPTPEELSRWSAELKQATSLQEAAEDLFWALLNSREFAFNH